MLNVPVTILVEFKLNEALFELVVNKLRFANPLSSAAEQLKFMKDSIKKNY